MENETFEFKIFQSKYYHNEHSRQRDNFLIQTFGEEWLINMKSKGYFGGDWPDEIIGTLKTGENKRSRSYDADGNEVKYCEEVDLDARNSKIKYVVYLTRYSGTKLPKWYIGSSSIEKIENGYNGSIKSKKWKEIYKHEQKHNKHLFKTRIISYHKTRKEALIEENRIQHLHEVVKNEKYFNEAYACQNGFFGMKLSNKLKRYIVKRRKENGNGKYHHTGNPFTFTYVINNIRNIQIQKTKNGVVSKYNRTYEFFYNDEYYTSVSKLCKKINYSPKLLRKFLNKNNLISLNNELIQNLLFLKELEPSLKWMHRNTIEKDGILYFLYFKLEIPENFILKEKYENK